MPRRKVPCSACGKLLFSATSSLAEGQRRCRSCRAVARCGTVNGYRKGCRCDGCRSAKAAAVSAYSKRRRAEGFNFDEYRRAPCTSKPVTLATRRLVYERDGWVCQLCGNPVDPDLPTLDRMAATLDHVEPQSWSLVPDHRLENLQLAHRSCNSIKGARSVAPASVGA